MDRSVQKNVRRPLRLNLNELTVSISNSCKPFQPLEDKYKHALFAIKLLTENEFRLIFETKNPSKLLEREYLETIDPKRTFIEATITSLNSKFLEPNAPTSQKRIEAVAGLIKLGFTAAVRVDPIIPRFGNIPGQSPSDIEALIERLHGLGLRFVIAKCLRLVGATAKMYPDFYHSLRP